MCVNKSSGKKPELVGESQVDWRSTSRTVFSWHQKVPGNVTPITCFC